MAPTKLPDPLSRRYLLEREVDPTKALAYAEAYLEAGRELEAIEFLARAGATERLEELQAAAVERGDVFLMKAVSGAIGREPSAEIWRELREAAARAGRERDAETAARLAKVEA
ncbi:MAG: hypothetical protein JRG86_17535 [Deltaproteobacteria bacterium]|nr:hypothetical protein [Deltaproteobacteria bacterium]MBW2497213.1 hypothetical protein [Deltaproteobacteria bacterium]